MVIKWTIVSQGLVLSHLLSTKKNLQKLSTKNPEKNQIIYKVTLYKNLNDFSENSYFLKTKQDTQKAGWNLILRLCLPDEGHKDKLETMSSYCWMFDNSNVTIYGN